MPNRVQSNPQLPCIERSDALWARAQGLVPAGTQTLAKGPTQFSRGVAPKYLARGSGARVWDVDGNEFLDFNMGIGPIILGYCHPVVDEAIRRQLEDAITFSLMHPLEVELAELLREVVPHAESVRFSKTGCDATSAAVRLARAYTGRERVLCCGYHGWHDWYIAVTDRAAGIPAATAELTATFRYNDIDSVLSALDTDTACVILEPFTFEREQNGFLAELRRLCDRDGALLIFDEMWTGFRSALGGAQAFLGVRSDLSLFSKAMANGMPISAVTGRRDVMSLLEKDVFFLPPSGARPCRSPPRSPASGTFAITGSSSASPCAASRSWRACNGSSGGSGSILSRSRAICSGRWSVLIPQRAIPGPGSIALSRPRGPPAFLQVPCRLG
ncbi:MAG: aminotransferase class III-fold pyridoxal phosphate-dependent enzyme [Gammaproteobacteria bacterium]